MGGTWLVSSPQGGREGTGRWRRGRRGQRGPAAAWARKRLLGRFLLQEGPSPMAEPGFAPLPDPAWPPWAGGWDPRLGGPMGAALCWLLSPLAPRVPLVSLCWWVYPKPSRHWGKEQREMLMVVGSRWERK